MKLLKVFLTAVFEMHVLYGFSAVPAYALRTQRRGADLPHPLYDGGNHGPEPSPP